MLSLISNLVIDCADAHGLSRWWKRTLGYVDDVEALLSRGAALVADHRGIGPGSGWQVLADPEGNESCVLRSAAERQAR